MSLQAKSAEQKTSTFWGKFHRRKEAEEHYDTEKILALSNILRKDADMLGIKNISLSVEDKQSDVFNSYTIMANKQGMQVTLPTYIGVEYKLIDKLSLDEMRSVLWHEFGHNLFTALYPEIGIKYTWDSKNPYYDVAEAFCDELAYKKFGYTYLIASLKADKYTFGKKNWKTISMRVMPMIEDIEKNGFGYWKRVAAKNGIEVKISKTSGGLGITPNKRALEGLI